MPKNQGSPKIGVHKKSDAFSAILNNFLQIYYSKSQEKNLSITKKCKTEKNQNITTQKSGDKKI